MEVGAKEERRVKEAQAVFSGKNRVPFSRDVLSAYFVSHTVVDSGINILVSAQRVFSFCWEGRRRFGQETNQQIKKMTFFFMAITALRRCFELGDGMIRENFPKEMNSH